MNPHPLFHSTSVCRNHFRFGLLSLVCLGFRLFSSCCLLTFLLLRSNHFRGFICSIYKLLLVVNCTQMKKSYHFQTPLCLKLRSIHIPKSLTVNLIKIFGIYLLKKNLIRMLKNTASIFLKNKNIIIKSNN